MIQNFLELEEFKKAVLLEQEIDLDSVLKLDTPFLENEEKFTLLRLPYYGDNSAQNVVFAMKDRTLVLSKIPFGKFEDKYKKILKKKFGESSFVIFLTLKDVLKNYSQEFYRIREIMDRLDLNPILDDVEKSGRDLRKLTDRVEALVQILLLLKETDIERFDTEILSFDYDTLLIEARYWLERCRSHIYRVASLRTKCEMRSNKQLNDTMSRLTVIMTFLTIVSIVVNVPGTVGAIFGIPALSDAYFKAHTSFLVATLVLTTGLSILLGLIYWKSLRLRNR